MLAKKRTVKGTIRVEIEGVDGYGYTTFRMSMGCVKEKECVEAIISANLDILKDNILEKLKDLSDDS